MPESLPCCLHVHYDGFTEKILAVKEFRTYPSGFSPETRWALVLRPRRGPRSWMLVPLSELFVEFPGRTVE